MADLAWTRVDLSIGVDEQWQLRGQEGLLALVSRHSGPQGDFFTISVRTAGGTMLPALDVVASLKLAQAECVRELAARGLLVAGREP